MSLPFSPGARRKLGANSKLDLELWSPKKGRDHSLTYSPLRAWSGEVGAVGRSRGGFTDDLKPGELGCWMPLSLPTPQSHLPEIIGSQGRQPEERGLGQAKTALRTVSESLESEVRGRLRHRTRMKNVKTETPAPTLGGLGSCFRTRARRGRTHLPRVSLHCRRSVPVWRREFPPPPHPSPPHPPPPPRTRTRLPMTALGRRSLAWSDVS